MFYTVKLTSAMLLEAMLFFFIKHWLYANKQNPLWTETQSLTHGNSASSQMNSVACRFHSAARTRGC